MSTARRLRIYVDTSVFGGYYDRVFAKETRSFFRLVRSRRITAVVSDMVVGEISRAPGPVQALLREAIRLGAEESAAGEASVELQEAYLKAGVLARRWEDDAMHVAMATLARADAIASWNFRHLLDPRKTREFNGVNVAMGYGLIAILSPTDIVRHMEGDE